MFRDISFILCKLNGFRNDHKYSQYLFHILIFLGDVFVVIPEAVAKGSLKSVMQKHVIMIYIYIIIK